ncbi:uncharacterized protein G2W53_007308 [Senna tora]|uniref:Uncharacterized protein n=1 Tax=Senna tora TaxID=362788 RepID=A0A835CDH9_9FABA|nr:uncharacterized protein G2W53_007308 [Senna tora]
MWAVLTVGFPTDLKHSFILVWSFSRSVFLFFRVYCIHAHLLPLLYFVALFSSFALSLWLLVILSSARPWAPCEEVVPGFEGPPKDWKKDFYLVRPRQGCRPSWWLRENGTSLFPTKWVEPFEAVPRTVLRTSSAETQSTVRVMSLLPPGLDIDDYLVTDKTGGKFNPTRVLSLVRREEAKHGKSRSADCSGSSSAHQTRPRDGTKEEDTKKSHGKGHSSHTGTKGKTSASSGPRRRGVPAVYVTETLPPDSAAGACEGPEASAPTEVVKLREESLKKEKIFLAAEKELELVRPEVASLRSNEQLLKVQLENAQKELQVWKSRSAAQGDKIRALRQAKDSLADGQRKLTADHSSLLAGYESLLKRLQEATGENIKLKDALDEEKETVKALTDDCSGAMEWGWGNCLNQKGLSDASQELSPDDMIEENPSKVLTLEATAPTPSAPAVEKAVAEEALLGTNSQVAAGAEERRDPSTHEVMGSQELEGGLPAELAGVESEIVESKPTASGEEFTNSILAD